MKPHLLQSYLTMDSCGITPVTLVTTPLVRISWFKCSCLKEELTLTNRCSHLLLGYILPVSRTPETKSETSWRPPLSAPSVCHPQRVRECIRAHMSQCQKVRTPHVTFLLFVFRKLKLHFQKKREEKCAIFLI